MFSGTVKFEEFVALFIKTVMELTLVVIVIAFIQSVFLILS